MKINVKYVGEDRADIRYGDKYEATEVNDDSRYYSIVDRSGESYAYPKQLFEILEENGIEV